MDYLEAIRKAAERQDWAEMERLRVEWNALVARENPPRVSPDNRGKIYVVRDKTKWQMTESEELPTGDEFEEFWHQLDSFLDGYFFALKAKEVPAYAPGDFFGERTEAIYFTDRSFLTEAFVVAAQRWLSIPRRENWRLLIPGDTQNTFIVIYGDSVVLPPKIKSLAEAIAR